MALVNIKVPLSLFKDLKNSKNKSMMKKILTRAKLFVILKKIGQVLILVMFNKFKFLKLNKKVKTHILFQDNPWNIWKKR